MVRLGVLGIPREVLGVPLRNPRLMACVLLLLLPCNLLLTVQKSQGPEVPRFRSPKVQKVVNIASPLANRLASLREGPSNGESSSVAVPGGPPAEVPRSRTLSTVVKPLSLVVGHLSTLALVYLSAVACKGKHSTAGELLSKIKRSWRKVAVSFLYGQLLVFMYACLILMLGGLTLIFKTHTLVLFLVLLALFSTFGFAFLIFLYLDIACRVGLVVSAVEEDKGGMVALAKAVSLIRVRKLQGIVLTALCFALNKFRPADYFKTGAEKRSQTTSLVVAWRLGGVIVDLSARLFVCLLWTVYYYECKKTHGLMGKEERADEGQSLIPRSCGAEGDHII